MEMLDFQGTISALQALFGRKVSVTFGNFQVNAPAFAGFAGVLEHAQRPGAEQLQITGGAEEQDRIFIFFAGPDEPFNRSWFTLDDRTFKSAVRTGPQRDPEVDEQVTISLNAGNITVTAPTDAYLANLGIEP